jgi:hypothetical protein
MQNDSDQPKNDGEVRCEIKGRNKIILKALGAYLLLL